MKRKTHPGPFSLEESIDPPKRKRKPIIWTNDLLREYEFQKVSERLRIYEEQCKNPPFITDEMPLHSYLESITTHERHALLKTFEAIFRTGGLNKGLSLMGLAVGTTTFPDSYWRDLRKYLRKEDKKKLSYVDRRGEDLDILLCFEQECASKSTLNTHQRILKRGLTEAGIRFKEQIGRENGTGYLNIPEENQMPSCD